VEEGKGVLVRCCPHPTPNPSYSKERDKEMDRGIRLQEAFGDGGEAKVWLGYQEIAFALAAAILIPIFWFAGQLIGNDHERDRRDWAAETGEGYLRPQVFGASGVGEGRPGPIIIEGSQGASRRMAVSRRSSVRKADKVRGVAVKAKKP